MRFTSQAIATMFIASALATLAVSTLGLGVFASLLSGAGLGTIGN
jgi:hypothetical protein